MSFITLYRTQLKQHTTSTLLLSVLIFFTVLVVILRLSLSAIIILSSEKWLASQQLVANIERIEISLFSGHVALHNVEAQNAQQQGFNIGELTLDWNWRPLFSNHVEINQLTLRDFSINAELHHDGTMNIGGIKLPANQATSIQTEETEQAQASIWQATIHNIELNNIKTCVAQLDQGNQPVLDYCSELEQLQWQGQLAYLPESTELQNTQSSLAVYTDGRFNLKMLKLHNNLLELDLLNIGEITLPHVKLESLDTIQLQTLNISQLSLLQQSTGNAAEKTAIGKQINHLLAFDNLKLGPVSIVQSHEIALGDIALRGLRSQAYINADNRLDIAAWIPGQSTQATDQDSDTSKTDEETQANSTATQQKSDTQPRSNSTDDQAIHLSINNIQLSDSKLCTEHAGNSQLKPLGYCLTLDDISWQGELNYGKPKDKTDDTKSPALPLYASGDFTVSQLGMQNNALQLKLLSVDRIQLDKIAMQTIEHIDIASLTIEQLATLERSKQSIENTSDPQTPYIVSFDQFSIQPIQLAPNEITLGKVKLTGSQATIVINQQGEAELKQWQVQPAAVENSQTTDASDNRPTDSVEKENDKADKDVKKAVEKDTITGTQTETQSASNTENALRVSLEELVFHTDRKTTFIDRSGQETMRLVIEQIDLQLKSINSIADEQQSSASLFIRLEDQATMKLDAQGTPLAEKPGIKGTGSISALDLRTFSPMSRQQIGQSIRSGQLDAELDINVEKGEVDSLLDLKLHHFVLRTLNEKEAEKLNKKLGFPLNTSLNLLRDKDDKIHLSIPITQDMDNLNIDIKPVIYKALSKSVSSAIVNYYTPFGLIFVAESLFDMATALRFKPVIFNLGEATLTEHNREELEKLATVMNERPGIHLTLCGYSNMHDLPQTGTDTANKSTAEKPSVEISREQRQLLIQLGESRSSVIKQYLVNEQQISASRLVECEAEYAADAIAGVEIKL